MSYYDRYEGDNAIGQPCDIQGCESKVEKANSVWCEVHTKSETAGRREYLLLHSPFKVKLLTACTVNEREAYVYDRIDVSNIAVARQYFRSKYKNLKYCDL
jgi:hypothetical protein